MSTYSSATRALEVTGDDRVAARELILGELLVEAVKEAAQAARSIKCATGQHHRLIGHGPGESYYAGCANDGSSCLCECHDGQVAK